MEREYCCVNCGLIWFGKREEEQGVTCPECENDGNIYGHDKGVFACDTISWFYASKASVQWLKERGREIHYQKGHPLHKDY